MSGINYNLADIKGMVFDVDGVLSPSAVPIGVDGQPQRMTNIKDGFALQLAVKKGFKLAIITGGNTEPVRLRYSKLGIRDIYLSAGSKIEILSKWMKDNDLKKDEVMYMGDDIPDLQCMRHAGLACAPYDACHEARETADYISRFTGGYGCVRDVIEQILRAQHEWTSDAPANS